MSLIDISVASANQPATTQTKTTFEQSLVEFERRILNHLRDATKPWIAISQEFRDAKRQLSNDLFKKLCEKVCLSYSTACKLVKVANCQRLLNYADRLACIDSWSTLHEIAKLDATSFDAFASQYLSNTNEVRLFKRSDVERFNRKSAKSASKFEILFSVQLSSASSLSTQDEQVIASVVQFLEEQLVGKCIVKWEVDKPSAKAIEIALVQ